MKNPYERLLTARVVREWFYEVIITSLLIEGIPIPIDCRNINTDKSIVDSGTTNVRLPGNVFKAFVEALIPATKKAFLLSRERQASIRKIFSRNGTVRISNEYEIEEWTLPDDFWWKQKALCWKEPQSWDGMPTLNIEVASAPDQYFRMDLPGAVCFHFIILRRFNWHHCINVLVID